MKKKLLFLLRITLGWLMFYAGLEKILSPDWSAKGYLENAQTFSGFYQWLASDPLIGFISLLNEWSLLLLGISLICGIFVRLSSILGVILMLLYYLPALSFPHVGAHGYLIDDHIIYALLLAYFATASAGRVWGLDYYLVKKFPKLKKIS